MKNFEKWDKAFRSQNLYIFNNDRNALLWLKVRAICRGKQIQQFLEDNNLTLSSPKMEGKNIELFEKMEAMPDAMKRLDNFLKKETMSGIVQRL